MLDPPPNEGVAMHLTIPALKMLHWCSENPGGAMPPADFLPADEMEIGWGNLADLEYVEVEEVLSGDRSGVLNRRGMTAALRIGPLARTLLLRAELLRWLAETSENSPTMQQFYDGHETSAAEMAPILQSLVHEGKIKALGRVGGGYARAILYPPGREEAMAGEVSIPFSGGQASSGSTTNLVNHGTQNFGAASIGGQGNVVTGTLNVAAAGGVLEALVALRDAVTAEPDLDERERADLVESVDEAMRESSEKDEAWLRRHARTISLAAATALGSEGGKAAVAALQGAIQGMG